MKVVGLSSAFAVGLAAVALANHVDPVHYGDEEGEENNPSCAFLNPDWNEVKVDQAPNGDYPDSGGTDNPGGDGALVFTVENSDGKTFDWRSNIGVDAVVVKGGNRGANVYLYDPEDTSDTGLYSPDNTKGNRPAVSHISACYDEETEGEEEEQPQDEGGEQQGGNERPADPDEPQQEEPQDDEQPQEEGADEPTDRGGSNERQADEEAEDEGNEESGQEQDTPEAEEQEDEGESDVEGISETDDGESDDVAEETGPTSDDDSGSGGELPFTGAPLGVLLLIGLVLTLAGVALRIAQRANPS